MKMDKQEPMFKVHEVWIEDNHSQFYHHTIPNFTIISKSTIHCLILLHPTTIFNSTIYCLLATKKSTINQLYQLLLILLHSTTISNSTIYCLFATKTTILPYHSQLYHHIQVYHLLPFCYKKNYHTIVSFPTYQLPPILLSTRILLETTSIYHKIIPNSTIYYSLLQMTTCYHRSN